MTANCIDAMRECVGKRIVGTLRGATPPHRPDASNLTFVFDDGTGFTMHGNGSYWTESADDIRWALNTKRKALDETKAMQEEILALAVGGDEEVDDGNG